MGSVKKRTVFSDITSSNNNHENIGIFDGNSYHKRKGKNLMKRSLKNKSTYITDINNITNSTENKKRTQSPEQAPSREDLEYDQKIEDMLAVKEYSQDIFEYLYQLDYNYFKTLKTPSYKIDIINREILVNWIIKVHSYFGFLEETLYLTVYIIDKFQSLNPTSIADLQLLGITSLFIASKTEEIMVPRVIYYSYQTDGCFSVRDIINFEIQILETLQYDLTYANPLNFIRRITKADDFNLPRRTIAKYLLEITLIDSKHFDKFPRAQCAAAAILLSRIMFGKRGWGSDFITYSGGYGKKDIIYICKLLIGYLLSPISHPDFQVKYESTRYLRASIICKEWVLAIMKQQKGKNLKKRVV